MVVVLSVHFGCLMHHSKICCGNVTMGWHGDYTIIFEFFQSYVSDSSYMCNNLGLSMLA